MGYQDWGRRSAVGLPVPRGRYQDTRHLLGGKDGSLPVPLSFTITTEACQGYLANGKQLFTEAM
jgi:hypothetical protein